MSCRRLAALGIALALASSISLAQTEPFCGELANAYGPFDYRKERGHALAIVDSNHFNSDVRNLRSSGQTGSLPADLDYVLRASPNHHPALATIADWGAKLQTSQPPGLKRSIDCYFERASRFQPDDHLVRMLYAHFLQRMGRKPEALTVLEPLEKLDNLDAFAHQNLGLLLLDLEEPERALDQAWISKELGWARSGLKERLEKAGKWREPPGDDADSKTPAAHQPAAANTPQPPAMGPASAAASAPTR